jgi:thiol:disulfide interchange protein DsbD
VYKRQDYYEGIEAARLQNKPVMIDFTGHGCVNCRRMEDQVWGQSGIYDMLKDKYVVISLYVDERKALEEPYTSAFDGKLKRTVGNKWADFQQTHFNRNSQPYYVLATADGIILNRPVAYTPNVEEYRQFLNCGLKRFQELKN